MQMEEAAQRIRGLACDLCSGEPLGEKGCAARVLCALAAVGNDPNSSERSEPGFYLYQSASRRNGVMFALSAGNCGDAPEGRALLRRLGPVNQPVYLLMDRAYEGDDTRALAAELGYIPVVPPKSNRENPWDYDKQLYRQRNQVERLFRRLKRFRRIFTRYDKLDVVFLSFVYFALVVDALM